MCILYVHGTRHFYKLGWRTSLKENSILFNIISYELITRVMCEIFHYNLILKFKHIIFHYKLKINIQISHLFK
jgi:hypothetical protein